MENELKNQNAKTASSTLPSIALNYSEIHLNTSDSYQKSDESLNDKKENLLTRLEDNSWRRFFLIKWKIYSKLLYAMVPYSYFMLISYCGTTCGNRIFKKYLKPILEKSMDINNSVS